MLGRRTSWWGLRGIGGVLLMMEGSPSPLRLAPRLVAGTVIHATNYSIFVVRSSGGGGGKFLRLRVQEFEGQTENALHRRRTYRIEGFGDDSGVRSGWTGVRGPERRSALQIQRS